MATIKDNAICIRLVDWSESSQIVVLMTEQHGKMSATAKGAKRTTPSTMAKFSGGVELLTGGEAVLIVKRQAELANLIEWDLREANWHLHRNLQMHRCAMYGADLVHHLVQDHDSHPKTYHALRELLRMSAEDDSMNPTDLSVGLAMLKFQWDVVCDSGHRPILTRDAQTDKALDESSATLAFSATHGGIVADIGAADRWRVRRETVELLRKLENDSADLLSHCSNSSEGLLRANRLLCAYFRVILDKELPTMKYVMG